MKKRVVTPAMLLVTIGVVYGDIGTSPMYVLKSIIENNGGLQTVNRAFIIGSLSLIIWTVTLITTVKYVVVAMKADNNGEGGIFALYSLVKNYGKYLVIPAMLGGAALLADGVLTPAVTITTAIEGLHSISVFDQLLNNDQNRVILITLISVLKGSLDLCKLNTKTSLLLKFLKEADFPAPLSPFIKTAKPIKIPPILYLFL